MPRRNGARPTDPAGDESASFFFDGIESPNGTIFPDALLDHVMPFLSPTEWKVCSYVVRRTFGWKKSSDRISLEQICHGIVRRDGTHLDHGTQLDRKTAVKALRGLEAKGVIVAQRNYSAARGFEPTTYGLRFRGQPPTRTLVEKLPRGDGELGELLHQGEVESVPHPLGADFPQAGGATPPALGVLFPPQPTSVPTNKQTIRSAPQVSQATARGDSRGGETEYPGGTRPPQEDIETEYRIVPDQAADVAVWAAVLAHLESRMTLANFQTWLAETAPLGRQGATLVVGAPSGFVRDWLQARFRPLVRRALQDVAPELTDVTFDVTPGAGR